MARFSATTGKEILEEKWARKRIQAACAMVAHLAETDESISAHDLAEFLDGFIVRMGPGQVFVRSEVSGPELNLQEGIFRHCGVQPGDTWVERVERLNTVIDDWAKDARGLSARLEKMYEDNQDPAARSALSDAIMELDRWLLHGKHGTRVAVPFARVVMKNAYNPNGAKAAATRASVIDQKATSGQ
jgi:hypothetical protein